LRNAEDGEVVSLLWMNTSSAGKGVLVSSSNITRLTEGKKGAQQRFYIAKRSLCVKRDEKRIHVLGFSDNRARLYRSAL
jgi:hypothetical protein